MMSARIVHWMVMTACSVMSMGCTSSTPAAVPSQGGEGVTRDSGADARSHAADRSDAATVTCTLSGETCGPGCCAPAGGRRVDRSRRCLEPSAPLFCPGPGTDCPSDTAEGCLMRRGDGGAEEEVFYTPSSWSDVPGFEACPAELYQEVSNLPECP